MILSVILLSMVIILLSTLNMIIWPDLWQQLEWGSELESDLRDTVDWVRKWLVDFNDGKINWFRLSCQIVLVLLMWKWVGLFLRKNHLLRSCSWLSLLNWTGALTLPLLLKLPPRKLELWLILWSFFLLRLLCISINLSYGHTCNTVVMSVLVLLVATWSCWVSYKNDCAGLLALHLLPLLNPWLIIKM